MYKKTPEPKNKAAKASALLTIICGAFLFVFASSGAIPYPVIAQTCGIVFLTFSIYVASVYLLKRYTFIVDDFGLTDSETDDYDFVITERRGKREIKVCHVSLKDIAFAREVNAKNKKEVTSDRKNKKRFTYDTQLWAARRIEIAIAYTDNGTDESISMLITYDDELLKVLSNLGVEIK